MASESALIYEVDGDSVVGILHVPDDDTGSDVGMVLVVGGPQYRVGSHRQFVLLARDLADAGIAVLRFDYRGMGDSAGDVRDFEVIQDDIRRAVEEFKSQLPSVRRIVLWGLCDAATANAFYAHGNPDIIGQVMLNPWVRTEQGEAEAYIKHYYLQRIVNPEFWKKLLTLQWNPFASIADFLRKFRAARGSTATIATVDNRPLPQRLEHCLQRYDGNVLLILSGNDLTAKEFESAVANSTSWVAWKNKPTVTTQRLEAADHTFSRRTWRDQVSKWTQDWIKQL